MKCPICRTETSTKYQGTPYFVCPNCSCWFQDPPPPKTYIADFEGDPTFMSEGDRQVNRELAAKLFQNVMGGKPGRTLDIGSKLPVFAAALADLGCDATVLEHEPIEHGLPVKTVAADWEEDYPLPLHNHDYQLITMIHVLEHLYDPKATFARLRRLVKDDGHVFIRMPDHSVQGYERDLTDGHFLIHPMFYSLSSILQLCYVTETFVVSDSWSLDGAGQRDLVLDPI